MKKPNTKKPAQLNLSTESLRVLLTTDLVQLAGGASGTYCAGCGTGTKCPQ